MDIKSIRTFILYNLAFMGVNSLFIKTDNTKALSISVITYFINYIFISFRNKK